MSANANTPLLQRRFTRRTVAGTVGVGALGLASGFAMTARAQDATPVTFADRSVLASSGPITIFDTGASLPTENVTVSWLENGTGPRTVFMTDFFAAYSQAHPTITVQYDHLPVPEHKQVLQIALQNDTAPDAFQLPSGSTGPQMVSAGYPAPLDDAVPNFSEWISTFPPNTFFDGIHLFDGKTYTFPITGDGAMVAALLFNSTYMTEAGFDPASKALTWDEFREAARKITETGAGEYYGLMLEGKQPERLAILISTLAELAGAPGGDFNWATGDFNFISDEFLAAIDLVLAIKQDGSLFPGSLQLNASQAREQIPQGVAGILLQGHWNVPQWIQAFPDFTFDVGSPPIPADGQVGHLSYAPGGTNHRFLSVRSEHPEIIGDMFALLGSPEGSYGWDVYTGGTEPLIFPEVRQGLERDPRVERVNALGESLMRLGPSPVVRNPAQGAVALERRPLTPNFGEVIQGLISGQLNDAQAAMRDLQDRANAELDAAIKAAQDKGAEVSRDDWAFANWDPASDYTQEMYAAL